MKNYRGSDYASNKKSAGIVYRFADGTTHTVALKDYLADNPDKTAADFQALKELSDGIYLRQVTKENAQTKKNTPLDELSAAMRYAPSPEELAIGEIDTREETLRREQRSELSRRALDALTEIQRRRYLLHHVTGLTLREIADMEGVGFTKIQKSIAAAEKKIKKFLGNS